LSWPRDSGRAVSALLAIPDEPPSLSLFKLRKQEWTVSRNRIGSHRHYILIPRLKEGLGA
jgi:hypothetical protein